MSQEKIDVVRKLYGGWALLATDRPEVALETSGLSG